MVKDEIIELLKSTNRPGMDRLIEHMIMNGFFTSPCSTQFHLNREAGLAIHSLNVYRQMSDFFYATDKRLDPNSIIIVSLLHDLGKMGQFGKPNYIENVLKGGKTSAAKPYVTNPNLLGVPHEIRSIQIASQFIQLTEDESYAILMHNGLYGPMKYEYSGKETPLSMLIHFADLWCSRVIEKE